MQHSPPIGFGRRARSFVSPCIEWACLTAIVSVVGFSSSISWAGEGGAAELQAGVYAIDVTPAEYPVIVNGGMTERTADRAIDRLHARCCVLSDGAETIAIVIVDSCMIPRQLLDEAKQTAAQATGIAMDRMLISATHTHSAPSVMGALGSRRDDRYAAYLTKQISRGIILAHERLQPVEVGWGVAQDPHNLYCRRWLMQPGTAPTNPFGGTQDDRAMMNPGVNNTNKIRQTGVVDPDVSVLSIRTLDGRPLGLLAAYSTHYAGAPALSADYFGVFCERMVEALRDEDPHEDFLAMLANGTSGDANCIDFTNPDRRFDRFTVAEEVARAAQRAYASIEYQRELPLEMVETTLTLDVRLPDDAELAAAQEVVASFEGRLPKNIPEVYAQEAVLLSELPPTRELKLQAIRLGDLAITAMPNEVFGSTGLKIKAASPFPVTMNIELANGAEGYIAPEEQHRLGGYTTWRARTSCLEVQAETKIRRTIVELLHGLHANETAGKQSAD